MSVEESNLGNTFQTIHGSALQCSFHKVCKRRVLFLYNKRDGSTGLDQTYYSCGNAKHREHVVRKCEGCVTYLSKIVQRHKPINDEYKITWKVVGTDVTLDHDPSCPMVSNVKDPVIMKRELTDISNEILKIESRSKENIESSRDILRVYYKELQRHAFALKVYDEAIRYMRKQVKYIGGFTNQAFVPNQDVCRICDVVMLKKDAVTLHECGHSFHIKCLSKRFSIQSKPTCLVCGYDCNFDRYFVYKNTTFRPDYARLTL